jgi:hypothetical protein
MLSRYNKSILHYKIDRERDEISILYYFEICCLDDEKIQHLNVHFLFAKAKVKHITTV